MRSAERHCRPGILPSTKVLKLGRSAQAMGLASDRRALAPVLYRPHGAFVVVLLGREKAVEIVGIIHRRKVRLATGKV